MRVTRQARLQATVQEECCASSFFDQCRDRQVPLPATHSTVCLCLRYCWLVRGLFGSWVFDGSCARVRQGSRVLLPCCPSIVLMPRRKRGMSRTRVSPQFHVK